MKNSLSRAYGFSRSQVVSPKCIEHEKMRKHQRAVVKSPFKVSEYLLLSFRKKKTFIYSLVILMSLLGCWLHCHFIATKFKINNNEHMSFFFVYSFIIFANDRIRISMKYVIDNLFRFFILFLELKDTRNVLVVFFSLQLFNTSVNYR